MKIQSGHYVTISSGELFEITQLRGSKAVMQNIRNGLNRTWSLTSVKPIFLQVGDAITIKYMDGVEVKFTLERILCTHYTYLFKFKTPQGSNETFTFEEVLSYMENGIS